MKWIIKQSALRHIYKSLHFRNASFTQTVGSRGHGKVCFYGQGSDSCQSAREFLFQNAPYVRHSTINHINKQTRGTIRLPGADATLRTRGGKIIRREPQGQDEGKKSETLASGANSNGMPKHPAIKIKVTL